jgi:TPR repeat protein
MQSFKRAVELDPDSPDYWLEYAKALFFNQDCGALAAAETYVEVCREDQECQLEPSWRDTIAQVAATQCSLPGKKWPKTLAERGDESGLGYKVCLEIRGTGDKVAAIEACRARAEAGDAAAQYDMGLLLVQGEFVERDEPGAFVWFSRAHENGDREATASVAGMLYRGMGVEPDQERAMALYIQAADAGVRAARLEIALAHYHGNGVEHDEAKGMALLRALADEGYVPAQRQLNRLANASG